MKPSARRRRSATSGRLIGIDTNVLVRLLVSDDARQASAAESAIAEAVLSSPVRIDLIILVETAWLLRQTYRLSLDDVLYAFEELLMNPDFQFEDENLVRETLSASRRYRVGFADCLIALRNRRHGCDTTLTCDRKAARLPEFRLLATE